MVQNKEINSISYPIMEHFYTIQGEGYNTGRAAYFIRFAGCDVACVWCDVKESWNLNNSTFYKIDSILNILNKNKSNFIVLTGGEPAMHNLNPLVNSLKTNNYEIAIETSGCYNLPENLDWICFSPKKFKKPLNDIYAKANELKVVIFNKSDFNWAEKQAEMVNSNCLLFLQAEWSKLEQILPLIIEYVKLNPKWKISTQTHKYLNIP